MPYQSGDILLNDKYRLESLIGRGAFGEVYRATHRTLSNTVALKVLAPAEKVDLTFFAEQQELL
jgi:eukaryotic-like serine/threonine-protein kinase